jgi:hypothetical protein
MPLSLEVKGLSEDSGTLLDILIDRDCRTTSFYELSFTSKRGSMFKEDLLSVF